MKLILLYLLVVIYSVFVDCNQISLTQPLDLLGTWQVTRYKGPPMVPAAEKLGIDTAHHYLLFMPESRLAASGAIPIIVELYVIDPNAGILDLTLQTDMREITMNEFIDFSSDGTLIKDSSYVKTCTANTLLGTFMKAGQGSFGHGKAYLPKGNNCQGYATKFMGIFNSI
jgi:hypothetical protein